MTRIQAVVLRGQLTMTHAGMVIRGKGKRTLAKQAGEFTGKKYKTSELNIAAADIKAILDEDLARMKEEGLI